MKKFLLPEGYNSYKANLHCHSNWSDGRYSPEELKQFYKAAGYSILCITDHEGLFSHYELDDDEFITLTGYELAFNYFRSDSYNDCITTHICAIATDKEGFVQPGADPNYQHRLMRWTVDDQKRSLIRYFGEPFEKNNHSPENVNMVIRVLKENGFIVNYNHPAWSLENYSHYINYTALDNLEIYNHSCHNSGYIEHCSLIFDDLLRSGADIGAVACDDNHGSEDMCGGFTVIRAKELSYDSIIKALKNRDYYCSSGPMIKSIYVEDGKLCIETQEPVEAIRFTTSLRKAALVRSRDGEKISFASYNIEDDMGYIRAEIIDGSNIAYTNAYSIKKLTK